MDQQSNDAKNELIGSIVVLLSSLTNLLKCYQNRHKQTVPLSSVLCMAYERYTGYYRQNPYSSNPFVPVSHDAIMKIVKDIIYEHKDDWNVVDDITGG